MSQQRKSGEAEVVVKGEEKVTTSIWRNHLYEPKNN